MGLAMATGRCWRSLLRTIPGFSPISDANILHLGSRDLDPDEERLFQQSDIEVVAPQEGEASNRQAIGTALENLRGKVARIYLHVDLDVLDTGEALPNHLAVPGGLSVGVVEDAIRMAKERFEVCAGAVTSFDPDYDKDDEVLAAAIRIVKALVA
jgi:arginase